MVTEATAIRIADAIRAADHIDKTEYLINFSPIAKWSANADIESEQWGNMSHCSYMKGMNLMAQFSTNATQTVAAGNNLNFTEPSGCSRNCNIVHRVGSGIFTLRGSNNCCNPAKYRIIFDANIAVATGGTVGAISVAISISGEPLYSATAIETPAAVGEFNNVSISKEITVPCNCCLTISIENTSGTTIDVANANIIVERVA